MAVKIKKRYIAAILLSVVVIYAGWKMTAPVDVQDAAVLSLSTVDVTVKAHGGDRSFKVEVADDPVEMEVGLMHRKSMDADRGMVFLFGATPRVVSFWMKNTLIPLDMLFVDENGVIAHIHHNAKPQDLTPISSEKPVTTVIEINGGLAEKYAIQPGDQVEMPVVIPKDEK